MLARLIVEVPFNIVISKTAKFPVYVYESDGYKIRIFPPSHSETASKDSMYDIKVDGDSGVICNTLMIEFQKEDFDRSSGAFDPPEKLIEEVIEFFIKRIRHVMSYPQAKMPLFSLGNSHLEYLNDDGTNLEKTGLPRAKITRAFSLSFVAITPKTWNILHGPAAEYSPFPWEELILDAKGELPKVGTSIVLSVTALEVFIGTTLNTLAKEKQISSELWTWINNRPDYAKNPSLLDQYDILLKVLLDHSLKEDQELWTTLRELKDARNNFVHEGQATIGKENILVDPKKAAELVLGAEKILNKIREWLPEKHKWPIFNAAADVEVKMTVLPSREKS